MNPALRSPAAAGLLLFLSATPVTAQERPWPAALDAAAPIEFFIAEPPSDPEFRAADRDLAHWALDAWAASSRGAINFGESGEEDAIIRLYWVQASDGQYGEMRPFEAGGRRGAAVFVRPDTGALGPEIASLAADDPLLRDTIVYLTCLHELGHALGLEHTSHYDDVMYAFGYGGDIPGFFMRYRNRLETREDIARHSGLSAGDVAQLQRLYPPPRFAF